MRLSKAGARVVLALVGIAAVAVMATASAFGGSTDKSVYIVEMKDSPAVAYAGGVPGLKATKPGKNQKIDPNSNDVVKYVDYLKGKHSDLLAKSGGSDKLYDYVYSFNGFAAKLTEKQAERLRSSKEVAAVNADEKLTLDTSSTPAFLGLSTPGGFWASKGVGEGVVIGIVDGGIWPESLSFSDRTGKNGNSSKDGKLSYQQIPGWHGKCVPGEQFNASNCNKKLIGAQYYNAGFGGNAGIDANYPDEFNSPRDFGGHGTHTASTAGGNQGVPTTGAAAVFGSVSGIAPRARIAAYKVCWQTPGGGSCFSSDSVAAIDQAVADGVDVINFSISGSRTNFRDSVEIAFLFAADAGVFVAASAGNSGPTTSTVAHPGPWLTTVAAGTHNRDGAGSVTLGNSVTYNGASVAAAVGPVGFVDAETALNPAYVHTPVSGIPDAATAVRLCVPGSLDPADVTGRIVLCDRGVIARVDKSRAVQTAGGVGMVLVNYPYLSSINADFHFVPTVHVNGCVGVNPVVSCVERSALKAYAATPGATATINAATIVSNAPAPFTASFSSRGPLLAGNGDVLKPDLIAPGQDILAAVAPPGNAGRDFDLYSGTSMSSPHVAGLGALLKGLHPDWSPMAIKSALMTTGTDVLDGGTPPASETNPVLIFRQGAGHVRPNTAADPGLVFDSGFGDWLGFLCGTQLPTSFCTDAGVQVLDPSNLNVPSIAIGDLAGTQTVTRKVTNVGSSAATYTAAIAGMAGFTTVVSPSSLSLQKGETKSFTVTFTRTTATLNAYTGGQLRLTDGTHTVRIPMVVRPVALAAPTEVTGSYSVTFGYDGAFTATARGLVAAVVAPGIVADDPTDGACSLTAPNAQKIVVAVPAGMTYARFSLFDADVNAGSDIDLCVADAAGAIVGSSGSGTSAEEVNLLGPAAGNYTVVVQGWGVVGSSPFKLHTWLLGSTAAGNMTVTAPASATTGGTGAIGITTSGLTAGTKYLGSVVYGGAAGMPNPTIVRVNP